MLKKKIILGTLVLGSCIAGITQATVMNMEVGETYNYNGASITCDNNANCVSEFGDTILTGLIQGNSLQNQIIIRVGNDIAYFKDYGTYNFSRRIMEGCFTSLTNGVNANDYTLNTIPNCSNSSGNFNTWIENASTYGSKLTSITFNTFGNQGLICWNYNEELGSFCVQFMNNNFNEAYDWGMISPITVEKLIAVGMSDSPFSGGPQTEGNPIQYRDTILTNDKVISMYESNGYRQELCYGGYPITKIYNEGDTLYSGYEINSGVNIIELGIANSGNDNTDIGEGTLTRGIANYYAQASYGYKNQGITYFIGKPMALATIMQQFIARQDRNNYQDQDHNLARLREYCEMKIYYNNTGDFTGTNYIARNRWDNIIGLESKPVTRPASGSVFDQLYQDEETIRNLSYLRNGDRDPFETIDSVWNKFTSIFYFRQGVQGIIPDIIVRGLWIILLVKIFRK